MTIIWRSDRPAPVEFKFIKNVELRRDTILELYRQIDAGQVRAYQNPSHDIWNIWSDNPRCRMELEEWAEAYAKGRQHAPSH